MIRALLIEDEAPARADLRMKLAEHPAVVILAEAATLHAARALLVRTDYDLVFLDVELIGGDSFALVPEVRPGARIIFVTGYDKYAVRAFEINALDYLLKPVVPARLAAALSRLADAATSAEAGDAAISPGATLRMEDVVYLRAGQRARFVAVADIGLITASDNYSEVHLADGSRVFLRKSLKEWEDALPGTHFMRVHRTRIVNLARITRYVRDGGGQAQVYIEGMAEAVEASRYRWNELRERLGALRPAP